jgi:DNA uptake protein ComE-like DNA-binding protein
MYFHLMVRRQLHGTLREQLNELFSLHWGERRGMLMLMLVILLLIGWVVRVQWFPPRSVHDLEPLRREMQVWLEQRQQSPQESHTLEPFPFDPNALDREGWLSMGFTMRQVESIERYTTKGGRFRTKRDVAKLYSLRPGQFEQLEPFILLPDSLPGRSTRKPVTKKESYATERPEKAAQEHPRSLPGKTYPSLRRVEVNSADSATLVALPGIGPAFARGIIKYRQQLGGYRDIDQLAEVHVLKDKPDALQRMRELLVVDTLLIMRIPINTCTAEELAAHPYARWRIAKQLIAYRQQHGPFQRVEDIRGCHALEEEVFRKLAPYLSAE